MRSLTYPESISPYIYRGGFDRNCEHELNLKGVGAFAFYEVELSADDEKRNRQAHNKAFNKSRGNIYYANSFLDRAQSVGFVMVVNGGEIQHFKLSCRKLRHAGKTREALLKDMIDNAMPIDPQKFCDPAENYRPNMGEISRLAMTKSSRPVTAKSTRPVSLD